MSRMYEALPPLPTFLHGDTLNSAQRLLPVDILQLLTEQAVVAMLVFHCGSIRVAEQALCNNNNNNNNNNNLLLLLLLLLLTEIGLSPGGSGYFTCKQNMKLVTNKFKSGGLHEKQCSGNLESWEPSQHLLINTGKTRKTGNRMFSAVLFSSTRRRLGSVFTCVIKPILFVSLIPSAVI